MNEDDFDRDDEDDFCFRGAQELDEHQMWLEDCRDRVADMREVFNDCYR